jgi:hypothetical protein
MINEEDGQPGPQTMDSRVISLTALPTLQTIFDLHIPKEYLAKRHSLISTTLMFVIRIIIFCMEL